jgi:hypothetical protein
MQSTSSESRKTRGSRKEPHRRHLVLLATLFAASSLAGAEEARDHQRIVSYSPKPLTVSTEATILMHPGSGRQVAIGGAESEVSLVLRDRWDVSFRGMVPVDLVADPGQPYRLCRSDEVHLEADAGVSLGPPYRRHRVGASAGHQSAGGLNYTLFSIRDPLVHGIGIVVELQREADAVETTVSVPLSIALVANDMTAIHGELIPRIIDINGDPRAGLNAVFSVRWAWERWSAGSAALFGQRGAPEGMALTGGWRWKKNE